MPQAVAIYLLLAVAMQRPSQASGAGHLSPGTWQRLDDSFGCLPSTAAFADAGPWKALGDIDCVRLVSAKIPAELGLALAQFSPSNAACQGMLLPAACSAARQAGRSCIILARLPIELAALSPKFQGVWLGSGGARFENLMCLTDARKSARFQAFDVKWRPEGVVFDAPNSHMLLQAVKDGPVTLASPFTWLLRLKRQPQLQPFVDVVRGSSRRVHSSLWEFNETCRIQFQTLGTLPMGFVRSQFSAMPDDETVWLDIGVTASNKTMQIYLSGGLLPLSDDSGVWDNAAPINNNETLWLYLGHRWFSARSNDSFKGTISAFVHANYQLTELEMQAMFAALPSSDTVV